MIGRKAPAIRPARPNATERASSGSEIEEPIRTVSRTVRVGARCPSLRGARASFEVSLRVVRMDPDDPDGTDPSVLSLAGMSWADD